MQRCKKNATIERLGVCSVQTTGGTPATTALSVALALTVCVGPSIVQAVILLRPFAGNPCVLWSIVVNAVLFISRFE